MENRKIVIAKHVGAGETVENGYSNGYCTAPQTEGVYTLYELADEHNCHIGWKWEREYINPDTGEIWTEEEIEETYKGIPELQEQWPEFSDYLEYLKDTGGIVPA